MLKLEEEIKDQLDLDITEIEDTAIIEELLENEDPIEESIKPPTEILLDSLQEEYLLTRDEKIWQEMFTTCVPYAKSLIDRYPDSYIGIQAKKDLNKLMSDGFIEKKTSKMRDKNAKYVVSNK